jgi:hypothetical protein
MPALVRDKDGNLTASVKVGDIVGFKSDYEQYGEVTKIERNSYNSEYMLTLHSPEGFGGDYLRYATTTIECASDCWAIR